MLNNSKKNEELLDKLKVNLNLTRVDTLASINVLSNNNKALDYFLATVNEVHKKNELILRIYGLLQALFVSIDSLYTLSISTTRTKNFISLNDNKELRELKFIRNDVVGHPTNRIVSNRIEYSILKPEDIFDDRLTYTIFYEDNEIKREVNLISLINTFYIESNHFLESLLSYKITENTKELSDDVLNTYNFLMKHENITANLRNLKSQYNKRNPNDRIMKKINLLIDLNKEYLNYNNINTFYVLAFHLKSLYMTICQFEGLRPQSIKLPSLTSALQGVRKQIYTKPMLKEIFEHLYDVNHPLFNKSISKIGYIFKNNEYINLLLRYARANKNSFVYAFAKILMTL